MLKLLNEKSINNTILVMYDDEYNIGLFERHFEGTDKVDYVWSYYYYGKLFWENGHYHSELQSCLHDMLERLEEMQTEHRNYLRFCAIEELLLIVALGRENEIVEHFVEWTHSDFYQLKRIFPNFKDNIVNNLEYIDCYIKARNKTYINEQWTELEDLKRLVCDTVSVEKMQECSKLANNIVWGD